MQVNWATCVEVVGCDSWRASESTMAQPCAVLKIPLVPVFAAEILAVFSRQSDTPNRGKCLLTAVSSC